MTLIDGIFNAYVRDEVERNIANKLPQALPNCQKILQTALIEVPDPSLNDIIQLHGLADLKDLPVLASAIQQKCDYLTTFNIKDYWQSPQHLQIVEPGQLVQNIRCVSARFVIP